ncbi:MAG: sugar transporter [Zetaproteobacteria bacterium]|nr:MAG: sugar transporter [Zetaproteobacteria bacterium]
MALDEDRLHLADTTDPGIEAEYENRLTIVPLNASTILQLARRELEARPKAGLPVPDDQGYVYRVGPQDVLQVTVWDHPELTTPAGQFRTAAETGNLVRQDGTIFYPYIGVVHVAGKTLEEIRQILAEKLSRYIEKPQVDVRVAAYRSQKVYVTGEVVKPGVLPVTDAPLHVLDAIQAAGGVRLTGQTATEADLEHVRLTRDGRVYTINVLAMLLGGDLSSNVLLRDGDVLHVPDNFTNKVFVMGEVKTPAALLIHNGRLTLAEALSEAGGVNMETADAGQVYVIRGGELAVNTDDKVEIAKAFKPMIYHLDASSPDALILADQFRLKPHDVVFVSAAPIVRWGRVLNQLQGTIQSIAVIRALTK